MRFRFLALMSFLLLICALFCGCDVSGLADDVIVLKEYDSIEKLHTDYVQKSSNEGNLNLGFYPRDLVTYFEYEDKYFVICTYSESKDDLLVEDGKLLVYTVSVSDECFMLDINGIGLNCAVFAISDTDYKENLMGICHINGETQHVSFVCKKYGDERCYYFDGVRMDEVEFTDPFSGERVVLCYGVSDSISFIQMMLGVKHKWHLIADSPANYIKHSVHEHSDHITVCIEVPVMPTSDEFLIEYTNILADELDNSEAAQRILNGGKVDRRQLYAELKLHIVAWNWGVEKTKTIIADIEIFDGGAVIDSRPWLNDLALWLYGDEYTE